MREICVVSKKRRVLPLTWFTVRTGEPRTPVLTRFTQVGRESINPGRNPSPSEVFLFSKFTLKIKSFPIRELAGIVGVI